MTDTSKGADRTHRTLPIMIDEVAEERSVPGLVEHTVRIRGPFYVGFAFACGAIIPTGIVAALVYAFWPWS